MTTGSPLPHGLPGLDPTWSRTLSAPDAEGTPRTWHVLDNGPLLAAAGIAVEQTLLCVHGNPTWSYLWRRVLAEAPRGWRVVAVDHLGMGYSERTESPRTLGQRVQDLGALTQALGIDGPVSTLAHDWGGPISLGWALAHRDQLQQVVLTNTAVHQPEGSPLPSAIATVRTPPLLDLITRRTPGFVWAATATCRPALPEAVRASFAAPYATAARRTAVRDFVADIPVSTGHLSHATLTEIADGLGALAEVPSLLVWGLADPVFSGRYLADLQARLPHADVHTYPDASHLPLEDRPEGVSLIWDWLTDRPDEVAATPSSVVPIRIDPSAPERTAIVELTGDGGHITFGALADRVEDLARGLHARGVRRGQRVALLVKPGIDLTTVLYAVWRLGAVAVVADAGLGRRRLGAALRGAAPDHVIGFPAARALVVAAGVPGQWIRLGSEDVALLMAEGVGHPISDGELLSPTAELDRDGAVLFTSGATGPPKGVVYTRRQVGAQVALLRDTFALRPGERFVAAFAPFALYGPALGLTSAVPDMDVTAPDTLTAATLADAVEAVDASIVFASPAALSNVVDTADELSAAQREQLRRPELVLSAGAPVPAALLRRVKELLPAAETQTPYGMTEALPVATLDPTSLDPDDPADQQAGVCVGVPLEGVTVRLAPVQADGTTSAELTSATGVLGEIVVRAPHVKERYDRLWGTQRASARPPGWHRTGDVGHLDDRGRLWVEGRLAHVITTAEGPVAPYAVEQAIETVPGVRRAAVVGVGPAGTQQVVAIVVPQGASARHRRQADTTVPAEVAARVRKAATLRVMAGPQDTAGVPVDLRGVPIAAVLRKDWLPVDIRHAAKVDRTELARWATTLLHGRKTARESFRRHPRAPSRRSR
ncbi:alpha/beta fold hydrolase [Ornithinimicrobium murale]|uniref:alpha/beta fold hydrolase n=1 Tax=Ornithinimicrobium murale TaxID=1050153 RepID=UPI001EE07E39|nr:alpha/beta fold hydrolase [Ornithinimicrobium murale]